jgi:hypothetical protein
MTTDELINGLKHMADDHPCCRETITVAIAKIEVETATAKRWEETAWAISREKERIENENARLRTGLSAIANGYPAWDAEDRLRRLARNYLSNIGMVSTDTTGKSANQ